MGALWEVRTFPQAPGTPRITAGSPAFWGSPPALPTSALNLGILESWGAFRTTEATLPPFHVIALGGGLSSGLVSKPPW